MSTNKNSKRENTPANARLKARVKEIARLIDEVNVELGIDPEFGSGGSSKSGLPQLPQLPSLPKLPN